MNGLVSVAIEADQAIFQRYIRGTISSGCGTDIVVTVASTIPSQFAVLDITLKSDGRSGSFPALHEQHHLNCD